ncbi:MAG: CbtB-domain containing protein [Rhizobiaceae bacterium]
MTARTLTQRQTRVSERAKAAFLALFLGAFFVWGAGLANSAVLHDAAHDTRHSYGFPCH